MKYFQVGVFITGQVTEHVEAETEEQAAEKARAQAAARCRELEFPDLVVTGIVDESDER
jgi:hypothetical protein